MTGHTGDRDASIFLPLQITKDKIRQPAWNWDHPKDNSLDLSKSLSQTSMINFYKCISIVSSCLSIIDDLSLWDVLGKTS